MTERNAERRRAPVPAGRVWSTEGLTPEQIAGGMWRVRWTDETGVDHDVVAIPVVHWEQRPRDTTSSEDAPGG